MVDVIQTERLRKLIEKRRKAYLWGQPSMITPRLVDEIFGDGRKLLQLWSLDHRPNYYVVRIDSHWDAGDMCHEDEITGDIHDYIDDIYESIEEQFGVCERSRDYFPKASFGSGSTWDVMDWPTKEIQKRINFNGVKK